MHFYPIAVRIDQESIVIVGAGRIAERKVKQLLLFGARVRVVAPEARNYILRLAQEGRVTWSKRRYRSSDVVGARFVIAATSDREINERIAQDAKKRGVLVNVVDHTAACEFISPAVICRRGLVISVSTDGKNPRRSKQFKDFLKRKLDEFHFGGNKL